MIMFLPTSGIPEAWTLWSYVTIQSNIHLQLLIIIH